ncbi:hypothetical protein BTVI_63819 [Pitangus sulphuratus]|nr:hypothetical protein BTVI_63819 [Pitangus sulphuratus]
MNLEQERPFVCSAPGCSQRFPTEDHLMIHRHKHEMTLKFPSIKTDNMLSDQTPTPTRFLKNCEEVGLFNDIDCSLEHEFRKAQEEENNKRNISMHNTVGGAMAGPGSHQLTNTRMPNHDTSVVIQQAMPSPQSSSVITQAPSTNRQIGFFVLALSGQAIREQIDRRVHFCFVFTTDVFMNFGKFLGLSENQFTNRKIRNTPSPYRNIEKNAAIAGAEDWITNAEYFLKLTNDRTLVSAAEQSETIGVRLSEGNNSAVTKVSEEGDGEGAPASRAEIPLWSVMKTLVRPAAYGGPWWEQISTCNPRRTPGQSNLKKALTLWEDHVGTGFWQKLGTHEETSPHWRRFAGRTCDHVGDPHWTVCS